MTKSISLVVCALAIAACGDLPQPSVPNGTKGSTSSGTNTDTTVIPDPPSVTVASSTSRSTVAVQGRAEVNTTNPVNVVIEGGASRSTATPVDKTTGSFCATIPLNEGKNELRIMTQRQDGSTSDPVKKTVTYTPASGTSTATVRASATDVLTYKTPGASIVGTPIGAMTDDDDTTFTTFSDYPSIYFDLGAQYEITDIEIVFSAASDTSGRYAEGYDLFTSTVPSPTRPVEEGTDGWNMIEQVAGASGGNGDGGVDQFSWGTPITTRWIGMNVTDNNTSWYSFDWSIEIASIRAIGTKVSTGGTGGGTGGDNVIDSCQ